MKTQTHVKHPARSAFTLIELLVVITIIAILAGIALPVFTSVEIKANQAKALSNAKQIALALRLYASDNNGVYPSYTIVNGQTTTTTVGSSNEAFSMLFPNYVQQEAIFWLSKSAFCSVGPPNEEQDNPPIDPPALTLGPGLGENEWAYVLELNDSSNPSVPLIADGFTSVSAHTYTVDQTQKGGVWKGQKAVVVHADSSGVLAPVTASTTPAYIVSGPNGSSGPGDIFTTANGANGWLGGGNTVVNPD